jgi:selT/selW/selH-like putative selenoprotein
VEVDLVEGAVGAFEVIADGKLVYSKLRNDRFPAYQEVPTLLLE